MWCCSGGDILLTELYYFFSADLMERKRSPREKEKTARVRFSVSLAHLYRIVKLLLFFSNKFICLAGRNERTVVMDKSKGEPVISVKTKSKERVSNH